MTKQELLTYTMNEQEAAIASFANNILSAILNEQNLQIDSIQTQYISGYGYFLKPQNMESYINNVELVPFIEQYLSKTLTLLFKNEQQMDFEQIITAKTVLPLLHTTSDFHYVFDEKGMAKGFIYKGQYWRINFICYDYTIHLIREGHDIPLSNTMVESLVKTQFQPESLEQEFLDAFLS